MKKPQENIDQDPIWDLLRQAPRKEAGPRFADDVLRAARLSDQEKPWWKRVSLPLAIGGLSTAATAAIVAMIVIQQAEVTPTGPGLAVIPPVEDAGSLESLDEIVRSEALLVIAENPAEFSDAELVSLIVY